MSNITETEREEMIVLAKKWNGKMTLEQKQNFCKEYESGACYNGGVAKVQYEMLKEEGVVSNSSSIQKTDNVETKGSISDMEKIGTMLQASVSNYSHSF